MKTYKYRKFEFQVEEGQLDMISPDHYDGQELEGDEPTENEFRAVICDWIDIKHNGLPNYGLDEFVIEPVRESFTTKEIIDIFDMDIVAYYDSL